MDVCIGPVPRGHVAKHLRGTLGKAIGGVFKVETVTVALSGRLYGGKLSGRPVLDKLPLASFIAEHR